MVIKGNILTIAINLIMLKGIIQGILIIIVIMIIITKANFVVTLNQAMFVLIVGDKDILKGTADFHRIDEVFII